jgi:amino acid transporter
MMGGVQLALILVLFTYGGWNEMAYVAGEVKRPDKNIVRALVFGTGAVLILYVLVNGAFLRALGYGGVANTQAVAVETVATAFPGGASAAISVLICISALGAVNGLILTGARISYAMGIEHRAFRGLGQWHPRLGTPVGALLVQGCLSLAIVLVAGSFVDAILYSAPVVWLFFMATALSVFVLRMKNPDVVRAYKVSGYPLTVILFIAACVFMFYNSVSYASKNKPFGLLIVALALASGGIVYTLTERRNARRPSEEQPSPPKMASS